MATRTKYYYKHKQGKGYLILEAPLTEKEAENYTALTYEQFVEETSPVSYTPTAKELANAEKKNQIEGLKAELAKTDYKCLKFVDGALTEEEYAEVRTYRQSLRDQINQLESELE